MSVDRRAIRIVLAALELENGELAHQLGYDDGYAANVLTGHSPASPAFRRALGDVIVSLLLGPYEGSVRESYPAEPLVSLVRRRAVEAPSKRDFYAGIGTSPQALRNRKTFDGIFVDRICCALGVHPSSVYGRDYEVAS